MYAVHYTRPDHPDHPTAKNGTSHPQTQTLSMPRRVVRQRVCLHKLQMLVRELHRLPDKRVLQRMPVVHTVHGVRAMQIVCQLHRRNQLYRLQGLYRM
jgi:hypothetical protein